jgi:hypothetical protein
MTPRLEEELDEHAQCFLVQHNIDEPVTWHLPPIWFSRLSILATIMTESNSEMLAPGQLPDRGPGPKPRRDLWPVSHHLPRRSS